MSEYDAFFDAILTAAYRSQTGIGYVNLGVLASEASVNLKDYLAFQFAEDCEEVGYADVAQSHQAVSTWGVRIRAAGSRYVEQLLEANTKTSIHSISWTGLPTSFQLTEARKERLLLLLREAELALDEMGATNTEKAMARAYIVASRTLAEAPDPQSDLIWELINRANSLAGIASLFVSILALFSTASH